MCTARMVHTMRPGTLVTLHKPVTYAESSYVGTDTDRICTTV